VANSLSSLGVILREEGKLDDAETVARGVLEMLRGLGQEQEHPLLVAAALLDLAAAVSAAGNALPGDKRLEAKSKLDEADSLCRQAVAMQQKLLGDENPELAASLSLLGLVMGRREAAISEANDSQALLSAALSVQRKQLGAENPAFVDSLRTLGQILQSKLQLPEAETVFREVLAKQRKLAGKETASSRETLERLVRVLMQEKKFDDAEKLLSETLTPAFLKERSCLSFLERRTELMARLGRWQEAKADAARALELDPGEQNRYHTLAPLLVMLHDSPAYEQLCQKSLTAFANTSDAFVADRVAKDCLILPPHGMDLRVLDRLADTAVKVGLDGSRYSEYRRLSMPYFQFCKGLSEYRQGHFTQSAEWLRKSLQDTSINAQAEAYPVLAMAQWRLGEKDLARAALAEADVSAARLFPGRNNDEGVWFAWIFAKIWLDEAKGLIESGPTP
jgi:tetratricopeptide (TPR) repeat protein